MKTWKEIRAEKYLEINSTGYTHNGQLPAAACPRCGGWSNVGGMSKHYTANEPVMGRFGCKVGCANSHGLTDR